MVKLSIDLGDVEVSDFRVIDAGKYEARVDDINEKESSSGHPMLVWTWTIDKGPEHGTTLKSYTTLQEHALFGLKQHLTAFGVDGSLTGFETDSLIGKRAKLVVTKPKLVNRETGEDMEVNRVDKVYPLDKPSANGAGARAATPKGGAIPL